MKIGQRKFVLTSLSVLFIMGFVLAGCSSSGNSDGKGNKKIELEFVNWASAEDVSKKKIDKVISKFEDENPNIKIKNTSVGFADIPDKLTVRSTTGDAPDVAQVPPEVGGSLASSNVLEPVGDLLSKDFKSHVKKSYYDTGKLDGKHYLIPWEGGTNGFWYNKKIMKKAGLDPNQPPKTMDELNDDMAKVKKVKDVIPLSLDITPRAFSTLFQWPLMKAMGEAPFDKNNNQMDKMGDYAKWLRNVVDKKYTVPGKKLGYFRQLAAKGRVAFMIDYPGLKGTIQGLNKMSDDDFYDTWGVTNLPAGPDGKNYTDGGSDHYLAVFKDSEHKKAAAKFAEYLANSDEAIKDYSLTLGMLPVTDNAADRFSEYKDDKTVKKFTDDIVPNTVNVPLGGSFSERASTVGTYLQKAATQSKSIQDILDQGQKKLEDSK